jgi:hypothetical protein
VVHSVHNQIGIVDGLVLFCCIIRLFRLLVVSIQFGNVEFIVFVDGLRLPNLGC